jgi:iron-sulfur cluster assembly protein
MYAMGFDESSMEDELIRSGGVTVVIAPKEKALLQGTVLDYVELEPGDFKFIFMNPNDPNYVPPSA